MYIYKFKPELTSDRVVMCREALTVRVEV